MSPTQSVAAGSTDWYTLDPPISGLHSGDLIGLYTATGFNCQLITGNTDDTVRAWAGTPTVGGSPTFDSPGGSSVLNVEAVGDYDPAFNEAPVATADAYRTPAGNDLVVDAPGVLVNDTDYEGDALEIAGAYINGALTTAQGGEVMMSSDGSFQYTPADGYVGTDSFTYAATDGLHTSNTTTVTISVPGPIDLGSLGGSSSSLTSTDGHWASGWAYTTGGAEEHAIAADLTAATPQIIDLGTLGGTYAEAAAVDGGWVVGESYVTGDGATHAFAYNTAARSPSMIDLGTLGGAESSAEDVDSGVAVGSAYNSSGYNHAFTVELTAKRLRLVDLGTLSGGSWSRANAIDGHWVVGAGDSSVGYEGAAWDLSTQPATIVELPPLSGDDAADAWGVSGDWAIGSSYIYGGATHAVAWHLTATSPTAVLLTGLGGGSDYLNGVGGTWAVGQSYGSGNYLPVLWDLNSGSPSAVSLGSDQGSANAVGRGWVVGESNTQAFAVDLADASHTLVRLGNLGGYSSAYAVAGGWAVGQAEVAGDYHAAAFRIADMLTASADLSVSIIGLGAAHAGKPYSVTVRTANAGPSTVTDVTLVVDGAAYPTFTLNAGASRDETVTVTAGPGGRGATLTIAATVSSAGGMVDTNPSNNTAALTVPIKGRG